MQCKAMKAEFRRKAPTKDGEKLVQYESESSDEQCKRRKEKKDRNTEFRGKVGVISGGTGGGRRFAFGLLSVFGCSGGSVGGISRRRWDGGRLRLTTNLRLAFPITHVDGLGELSEVGECGGFTNAGDFILDAVGEAIVEMVPESTFSVASDLRGYMVELHNVLSNPLAIRHRQVVQLMFCISDRVMRTKIGLEFYDELSIVVHPEGSERRSCDEQ